MVTQEEHNAVARRVSKLERDLASALARVRMLEQHVSMGGERVPPGGYALVPSYPLDANDKPLAQPGNPA
jgi:hypothetical protein